MFFIDRMNKRDGIIYHISFTLVGLIDNRDGNVSKYVLSDWSGCQ